MPATRLLALVVPLLVGLPALPAAAAQPAAPAAPGTQVAALVELPDGRLEVRRRLGGSPSEARRVADRWRTERGVVAADVDVPVRASSVPPVDPLQSSQWGLVASRTDLAWQSGDASGQVIAVIDSGVDLAHPDLQAAVVAGRDLVDGDDVPDDPAGHGTHVAGIAAAVAGNGEGVAGAGLRAAIMPVRVLAADGSGSAATVAEGIIWATDRGASVVNLSLGGAQSNSVLERAVSYALGKGVSVVAATGNEGGPVSYPAAYPGVIAVGAVGRDGARAPFSNTGPQVAVTAPGVDILSTLPGGYGYVSGTSMATPLVAGVAALVRARQPALGPAAVSERLRATAVDAGRTGFDAEYGAGRVDAVAAVRPSPITLKYTALGGSTSFLGTPTTGELAVAGGRERVFRGGRIYWSSASGAAEVHGGILTRYRALGGPASALSFPVTDERGTPDGRGRFNHFRNGSVYWSPATGAAEVRGAIRHTWASLGWERSALGYPTTDERGTPDGRGRFNHFQSGSVYWTPTTGAREVRGAIRQAWASIGWERSALGYPTRNEYAVPGGRASDFERGRITWDARTGAVTIRRY